MTSWLTVVVSLVGLLTGAGLAVVGAHLKEPSLVNLASTIIGGALGALVPQGRTTHPAELVERKS